MLFIREKLASTNCIITFKDGRRLPAVVLDCAISGAAIDC